MDSGEYGCGLFMTPLTPGVDCPSYATFLPALIADDFGKPLDQVLQEYIQANSPIAPTVEGRITRVDVQ